MYPPSEWPTGAGTVASLLTYIGDLALTTRGYDLAGGGFGVYLANGRARFTGVAVRTLAGAHAARGAAMRAA